MSDFAQPHETVIGSEDQESCKQRSDEKLSSVLSPPRTEILENVKTNTTGLLDTGVQDSVNGAVHHSDPALTNNGRQNGQELTHRPQIGESFADEQSSGNCGAEATSSSNPHVHPRGSPHPDNNPVSRNGQDKAEIHDDETVRPSGGAPEQLADRSRGRSGSLSRDEDRSSRSRSRSPRHSSRRTRFAARCVCIPSRHRRSRSV